MTSIWPSLIYLSLTFLGLGLQWEQAGSSGKKIFVHFIAVAGMIGLLYWGNFFEPLLSKVG